MDTSRELRSFGARAGIAALATLALAALPACSPQRDVGATTPAGMPAATDTPPAPAPLDNTLAAPSAPAAGSAPSPHGTAGNTAGNAPEASPSAADLPPGHDLGGGAGGGSSVTTVPGSGAPPGSSESGSGAPVVEGRTTAAPENVGRANLSGARPDAIDSGERTPPGRFPTGPGTR